MPVTVTAIVWSKAMSRASQVVSPMPVVSNLATQNISVISGTLLSSVETRVGVGVPVEGIEGPSSESSTATAGRPGRAPP